MKIKDSRFFLIGELVIFFVFMPVLFVLDFLPSTVKVVPAILILLYCILILYRKNFAIQDDFKLQRVGAVFWIKLFFFPAFLFSVLWYFFPEYLLADFSNKRLLLAILSYPIFSVLPQELIYRKFFYFRYGKLFHDRNFLIWINAILFSFAHIYFQNYISLVLTLIGGIAFTSSYFKTKSLFYVSLEHSVYGLAILCSGLSQFFYKAL